MTFLYIFFLLFFGVLLLIQIRKKVKTIKLIELIRRGDKQLYAGILVWFFVIVITLFGPYNISNKNKDFIGKWKNYKYELIISENGTCIYSEKTENGFIQRRSLPVRINRRKNLMRITGFFLPFYIETFHINQYPTLEINEKKDTMYIMTLDKYKFLKKK